MKTTMNLKQLFSQSFPSLNFLFDLPLSQRSYFKIGGQAEVFYAAQTRQEAIKLLLFSVGILFFSYIAPIASTAFKEDRCIKSLAPAMLIITFSYILK